MRMHHWVALAAIAIAFYALGVKYPTWGHQLGL